MKSLMFISLLISLASFPATASTLLKSTQQARAKEQTMNKQREAEFLSEEQELKALRDSLLARRSQVQSIIDTLSDQFSTNEKLLAEKEKKLHLESGSLGELFGVVRQVAKEIQVHQSNSVAAITQEENFRTLEEIVGARRLPSKAQLYTLWNTLNDQLEAGSKLSYVTVPYTQANGVHGSKQVLRIGAFGLVDESGYLVWKGKGHSARPYAVQPGAAPGMKASKASGQLLAFDPSQGKLLEQLSLAPTLKQRINQGGAVGKVILGILALGVVIGLTQGSFLFITQAKVRRQLKDITAIGNNALGRVLSVYKYDQSPNVEALELRLYETILDEQQKLERGLSMLKLLAALSPMLGLLGTVTGMIETFQVITQYGNADPRIMASGISTALVTTVLGLIAAMPLLFLHNVLSSQAENIRTLLEKQGIGLVAQRAEQDMTLRAA
ncbi:MotA/TolQ/ExbB proton channel family protein [Vibrio sp. JC009]|uniref:MotA/TolQ/ExbB proton channel family protein n=1 Tax=Vibrio sp. JC009 TaxID=2912314 RepID=UPI0023B1000F|nr:MotA/TolQ/ExbB proton channel family protein [Vibrio sp. JC009]WED23344.1 MotA/TolQ/ExbB proton channel family protein [Vibrio sp. JC009]